MLFVIIIGIVLFFILCYLFLNSKSVSVSNEVKSTVDKIQSSYEKKYFYLCASSWKYLAILQNPKELVFLKKSINQDILGFIRENAQTDKKMINLFIHRSFVISDYFYYLVVTKKIPDISQLKKIDQVIHKMIPNWNYQTNQNNLVFFMTEYLKSLETPKEIKESTPVYYYFEQFFDGHISVL